ncbi:MAG: hypothetical protein IJG48_01115 [Mogibacterium sp.]|nr:hypothetical protein [Mogibacterium sp.]
MTTCKSAISLGIPGQFDAPEFLQAVERVLKACRDAGKLCMMFSSNTDEAKKYIEQGFDAVANSIDSALFMEVYKDMVDDMRNA